MISRSALSSMVTGVWNNLAFLSLGFLWKNPELFGSWIWESLVWESATKTAFLVASGLPLRHWSAMLWISSSGVIKWKSVSHRWLAIKPCQPSDQARCNQMRPSVLPSTSILHYESMILGCYDETHIRLFTHFFSGVTLDFRIESSGASRKSSGFVERDKPGTCWEDQVSHLCMDLSSSTNGWSPTKSCMLLLCSWFKPSGAEGKELGG